MKTFNPKQDIFNLFRLNDKDFTVKDQSVDEIKIDISSQMTEGILQYFEDFVNSMRKKAYGTSEEKYVGFNIACDSIIQELNMSYLIKEDE